MPLVKSKSPEAFRKNVAAEVKAGKPVKQAVAIAYASQTRSSRAGQEKMKALQDCVIIERDMEKTPTVRAASEFGTARRE